MKNEPENTNDLHMSLGDHLEELRRRILWALAGLVIAMGVSLIFGKELLDLIANPYRDVASEMNLDAPLAALTVTDAFMTYFRVSLIAGLMLAAPWIFFQLWRFVAVGLYPSERRYVHMAVPFSAGLFVIGAIFFLLVVSRPMLRFFMTFTSWMQIQPVIRLRELVGFMTNLMLVFGIAFQTPVLVFALVRTGLVPHETMRYYRRHVIVAMLILAALVTSPSPVDQLALAIPVWVLYEVGLLISRPRRDKSGALKQRK